MRAQVAAIASSFSAVMFACIRTTWKLLHELPVKSLKTASGLFSGYPVNNFYLIT